MEGNSKIMKFIARDEQLHLKGTQYIIRQLQLGTDGEEWVQIARECFMRPLITSSGLSLVVAELVAGAPSPGP